MHAALGDTLFAFVEHDQLWLSPTYHKQIGWWQTRLDRGQLRRSGALAYGQILVEAYLQAHPAEAQRVGHTHILTVLLRALDSLRD
ncbi:hypothetical protein [Hymenobacter crusticola]|uniref:Uncharacterized protein n=1 Tax=Hymenobacter crusticola TaxID=1770526 RepID=A0A243W780_9BACT|nr:hypothetical protein [Hymenobacter crusticola]OUJ70281.1 hypothetical protein BXP70_24605 [Hymenobacter crusticola]